jgi:hypothetical protein
MHRGEGWVTRSKRQGMSLRVRSPRVGGVVTVAGPVPKRSAQRRRRNKPDVPTVSAPGAPVVERPEPDEAWEPGAARWYESLARSGQARFYEPSDWAQAWVWAELLSRALAQGQRPSAQLIMAWSSGATELLTTEGARRRMRIELERAGQVDEDEDAAVAALDDYRARFSF